MHIPYYEKKYYGGIIMGNLAFAVVVAIGWAIYGTIMYNEGRNQGHRDCQQKKPENKK
jgi:hypothetical protein